MRYSFISAAILAIVSAVSAAEPSADFDPMSVPTSATDSPKAGDVYTIKWTAPAKYTGTVTLKLLEGASAGTLSLDPTAIATGVQNTANEYAWKIPADIEAHAVYGIQISWDSDPTIFQWSFPFTITGTGASTSSVSSSAAVTAASVAESTSAASTKTVQLSSNTAYTAPTSTSAPVSSTTSAPASSSSAVIVVNSTTATVSAAPAVSSGNGSTTLSTSASLRPTASVTAASNGTQTSPSQISASGAAGGKMVPGGFVVLGGAMLAFAL